ncbi:MAG: tetratricopeptide repeat protein [Methylacidiphilales bacterium]|nr:tetratricopeptide repeat protein [Candidatus Methylacidiphilales bacterium]
MRADPSDDEKRALKAADQSFKDGAFDLCNDRITALLKKYPKTELAAEAELLQAQALYQVGRSDAALAALNLPPDQVPPNLQADTLFWQAESLLDLGKWPEAEQKYRALLALKDNDDRVDQANLGLAWALFKQGRETDALPLIQALIKNKGDSPAGQQAQLLLAKIELAKAQFKEAIAGLEALLAAQPDKGVAFETDYWLGETYSANSQPDQAAAAYQRITGDPQAFPKTLVARAWLGLGRAQHALQQNDQAMLAYEQTYHLTENEATRLDAFQSYLECARASGHLPEAVSTLQEFAKTSDLSAPAALFAIGSVLAEDHEDDKAIGILESLLVAYGTSPWVPAANDQLGQLYARTGKPDQAIKALNSCISTSTDPQLVRTARFQLGYVLLKQTGDYAGAAAQFAQISDGSDSSAENASYNFLLAQAYLGKSDLFTKAEADFKKRFPKSSHLKSIALAEGQLLANAGKTDDAKAVYQTAIATGGTGADQEALLNSLADLQYQTNDLEGTLATCKTIVDQFPDSALAAAQRGVLVSYELKKITEDQVEQALVQLAQKYKNVPGAPEAYFRLGEFYFNHQDYVRAQDAFQQLTANYPASSYSDSAYFYAGRAAFAHQDYAAALTMLEKVPDSSSLKPDARLWEGRVYQQQLKFDQANSLYDSVLATEKTGPRFVEASLLKGQCLFALGSHDPANYSLALAVFDQILKSKEGTIADRNQADVSAGKCLEKMGQTDEALGRFLDVLYGRVAGSNATSPAPPEFFWQYEAASEAGHIRELQKDWRGAIEIYKRAEQIGGAHAQDFHDLVNKLRRDNYIYE